MARRQTYHDQDRSYAGDDPLNPYNRPESPQYRPETRAEQPGKKPPPAPSPTPSAESPWSKPPSDGNWENWFFTNVRGTAPTPEALIALEGKLTPHGIKVLRNAAGIAGKIQLPDGSIIDVIENASSGNPGKMSWQWYTGSGAQTAAPSGGDWFAENAPPPPQYTTPERPDYLEGPYVAPQFTEQFAAPTMDSLAQDPGYQARMAEAMKGAERSAAARGSILSGGHQVALGRKLGELASNEYANHYGRLFEEYRQRAAQAGQNATLDMGARAMNERAFQDDVMNQHSQFSTRYKTYQDAIANQFKLADYGYGATTAGSPR